MPERVRLTQKGRHLLFCIHITAIFLTRMFLYVTMRIVIKKRRSKARIFDLPALSGIRPDGQPGQMPIGNFLLPY
jgi:hypothetical protein